MRQKSLRGSSIGSHSLESDVGVTFAPRKNVSYFCASCNRETVLIFDASADAPYLWKCGSCGGDAQAVGANPPEDLVEPKIERTPFDMLLERRTREELEVILQERLDYLRARRGA